MGSFVCEPKYTITDKILNLAAHISARVEVLNIQSSKKLDSEPSRAARIRNTYSSLAMEATPLSLEQVTAVVDGKCADVPPLDISKVKNTFEAYGQLFSFVPYDDADLLSAHRILVQNISEGAGQYRAKFIITPYTNGTGHPTSPENEISERVADLLRRVKLSKAHPLIKGCVFLYEFEMIYPFIRVTGQIGRMWHTLLLYQWKEIFARLPLEEMISERQQEYYAVFSKAIKSGGDCTELIQFMLEAIRATVDTYTVGDQVTDQESDQDSDQDNDQVKRLLDVLGNRTLSAAELMERLGLKHRPTFRKNYLHPALDAGLIEMTLPETPSARGQKYRRA